MIRLTFTSFAILLLAVPVSAAQPADPAKAACRQTMQSLCPGVQPGGGRLKACLEKQGKTLRQVCPELAAEHHPHTQQGAPFTSATPAPQGSSGPAAPAGTAPVPGDTFPSNP